MTATACTCIRNARLEVEVNDPKCPAPVHATRATLEQR